MANCRQTLQMRNVSCIYDTLEEHIPVFNCLDRLMGLINTLVAWIQSQLVRIRVFIEVWWCEHCHVIGA